MSATLLLFLIVFLSQIFLISVYYPMKIRRRILYILKNYPPSEYPKLYPAPFDHDAREAAKGGLKAYRNINLLIAAIGLAVLARGALLGYTPSPKGGDEIYVLLYFFLQVSPIFYLEFTWCKLHKRMREANTARARKADLNPRRLFDFISPAVFALAVVLLASWVTLFLYSEGFDQPWRWNVYVTLGAVTFANALMAGVAARHMLGRKLDPHMANKDRLLRIETIIKTSVFTSIAISVFLIINNLADTYALEVYDPVLMSVYFQLIAFFSFGLQILKFKVETLDFEVYKKDKPVAAS